MTRYREGTDTIIEAPFLELERVTNSPSGNPRFHVMLAGGYLYKTDVDHDVNTHIAGLDPYELKGKLIRLTLRWYGRIPALWITKFEVLGNVAQSEGGSDA